MKLNENEGELIDAAQKGNHDAFKALVELFEPKVAAVIYGMLGKCSEAEDIGQETFVRFYKALKNFKGEAAVSTYLIRIAINLSLNELKRRKRRGKFFPPSPKPGIEIEALPAENSSAYSHSEQEERKAIVQQALQRLDPKFRSVIVLRLIDGYSTQETARILKLPLGTVLSRLARAQTKLKKILAPLIPNEPHRAPDCSPFYRDTLPDSLISTVESSQVYPAGV